MKPLGWSDIAPGPRQDQVEICLFGPGYGECVVAHLGGNHWFIIDSCLDRETGNPVALEYLAAIGVNPAIHVDYVFASHWHDDHIRGLASTVEACATAEFCASAALLKEEFAAVVNAYEFRDQLVGGAGAREIYRVQRILSSRKATVARAICDKRLRDYGTSLPHGKQVSLWTLSPSNHQFDRFLAEISSLMPRTMTTKRRAVAKRPNDVCAVVWFEVGEHAALLGGDLEDDADPRLGWAAIVASKGRPTARASVYKIAHHGSASGHHQAVWDQLLTIQPLGLLSPFVHGGQRLPTTSDVDRITALTPSGFSTGRHGGLTRSRRDPAIERTLKEMGITVHHREPKTGLLRARLESGGWTVEQFNGACELSEVHH